MSRFTWIDHSEAQRRQILDAIDTFREKDTRDELGIAGIRDTFSDMFFPGTGALQTRARYFFFVPWMYLEFEAKRVAASEIERRGRTFELALIDKLSKAENHTGTIGIRAGGSLHRLPSSIYWNGLQALGLFQLSRSQFDYIQGLDTRRSADSAIRTNDDGEKVGGMTRAWHAGIPSAPGTFPATADFTLTAPEARYLKGRAIETHRLSLLAFLLDRGFDETGEAYLWDHPASDAVGAALRREICHARCFSEVIHGAAILYNLYLAEMEPRREAVIDKCTQLFDEWRGLVDLRRDAHMAWNRQDFWLLLAERGYVPSGPTRRFVDEWCRLALAGSPARLTDDVEARTLIFNREASIKGSLARCKNPRARETWQGEAGLGRMDYRWSNARTLLRDIMTGLESAHA